MKDGKIHLCNGFTLNLVRGCLEQSGELVHLRPQAYEVLKYLVENHGRLISKDKLIEDLWHGRAVTDGSLGKCIDEIRQALGSNARQCLRNVRGRGYIFELALDEVAPPPQSEPIDSVSLAAEGDDEEPGDAQNLDEESNLASWLEHRNRSERILVAVPPISSPEHPLSRSESSSRVAADLDIDDVQSSPAPGGRARWILRGRWLAFALVLVVVTLIAAAMGVRFSRSALAEPERRFEIGMPPTRDEIRDESAIAAISPDGLKIVFAATVAGQSQLWLRPLDSVSPRPLAGTEHGELPFWSPDSRSVGFFADGELKRVDLDGGSLRTLAHAEAGGGGSWGRTGTIIFSANPGRPILEIPDKSSEPTAVTLFEGPQQASQSFPQFLPDSRHFLYFVTGSPEARGIYIGQIGALSSHRLVDADSAAVYTSTGHLLFMRQGALLAQAFDPDRLELRGDTFPVAEHLGPWTTLSASAAGPIVYRTPPPGSGQQQLVWVDRSGSETDKVTYPNTGGLGASLSRDGRAVAMFKYTDGNMDIWSLDVERRVWNRITFDSRDDIYPVWSPDGGSIVFGSNRKEGGIQNLYRKQVGDAPGSEELVLASSQIKFATDWSSNGQFLLFDSIDQQKGSPDIWAVSLKGERKAFEVVHTVFKEQAGQFSPDGKWIAYQSDREGRFEIYVQAFPGPGDSVLVSANGGTQVRWNPNGNELFYVAPDGALMAVPIRIASNGQTIIPGTAAALFATNLRPSKRQLYMVSSDGRSFVMNSILYPISASPVTVILNWKPKP